MSRPAQLSRTAAVFFVPIRIFYVVKGNDTVRPAGLSFRHPPPVSRPAPPNICHFPDPPLKNGPLSQLLSRLKSLFADPRTREFLLWMLPAVLLAITLRGILVAHAPYAYYHDDAPDFFHTPHRLLEEGKMELHAKKTFLVPIVFTLPFLIKTPALIAIPIIHHVLGVAMVLIIGLLVRLWFSHWKLFILPVTLLAAANPFYLWFEHTIMAETIFVVTTLLVALAGTLYALSPSWPRFWFLTGALFLEAGARPEGKLLFGFGLFLLALLHWKAWRVEWRRFAILFAIALITHFITKTAQAGLLLYTSVARLTPTELSCAPGFEPYIAPIREDLNQRWAEKPQFPKVRDRRNIAAAVEKYLKDRAAKSGADKGSVDTFCFKLARETCLRNFGYLPVHTYHKFRFVSNEAPSGLLDNAWFFDKQREAYLDSQERVLFLSPGLIGRQLKDEAELRQFIESNYGEVPWFNAWQERWLKVTNALRFPDQRVPNPDWPTVPVYYNGVPYYFLAAGIGLIVVAFRRGVLQPFHVAWGLTLLAFFYTIMLTANVRPRFRFVFEPFWFIYLGLLLECAWGLVALPFRRRA